jgi:hypothetical protein
MRRHLVHVVLIVMFALASVGVASAAPKRNGSPQKPTITLAASSDARLGGIVSFVVSGVDGVAAPHTEVDCFEAADPSGMAAYVVGSGYRVYGEIRPVNQTFTLGGSISAWVLDGGPAHCVATVFYWDFHPTQTYHFLASTQFDAAA